MGVLTSQKIAAFYEQFRNIDVTYTRDIIQVTGLQPNEVYLKCVSDSWPCVIYSSSFQGAKIVANIKSGLVEKIQQANNSVSLRFCFKDPAQGEQLAFFVAARSVGYSPYGGSRDVALFTLEFTQRSPDDLIEIMGRLLAANITSAKRRDERILINTDTQRKLRILFNEGVVFLEGAPCRCILRDISFSGVKLVIMGVIESLLNREAVLQLEFEDPQERFLIKGAFIRGEDVEFRTDMAAMVLLFDEANIPMGYKMRINDYLSTIRGDVPGPVNVPKPEDGSESV
jgi:hypothetical protein